jgi:AcrR family transcriptional regulator
MARWDPGAEQRLRKAALELYAEHGYDSVTVNQIAEHAGLTRRSYFRYFPDKREVLFAGSERLPAAVTEAIRAVDPSVAPWPAVLQTAVAIGELLADMAEDTDVRRAVIAASPELQERERTKLASVTAALREGRRADGAGRLGGAPERVQPVDRRRRKAIVPVLPGCGCRVTPR